MGTGAESGGVRNAEAVISKVDRRIATDEDADEGTANGSVCRFSLPAPSLSEMKEELQSLAKIVCPIIMTSLLMYSRSVISMLFLGRQGKVELAGGSLAMGFANITANSVLKGLTMGMDPICCQAFGAKRWSLLSQTFFRTLCLLVLVTIPISLLWLNIAPVLHWLGQDPEVTKVAQVYMLFSIPELLAQAYFNPLRSFLRCQGLNTPVTIATCCAAILHLPLNYLLASYFKLGVKGIALATGLNSLNVILGLLLYLLLSNKPVKPWQLGAAASIDLTSYQGWRSLMSLALPSCISVCLEWWWYEIMLFLCGLLSDPQTTVATMGILIQTTGFLYVFPFSISIALTTRIGHSIGAGDPSRAYCAAIVGISAAFTLGVSAFVFLVSVRKVVGKLFTNEIQIIDLVETTLPILGLSEIGNWPQTASNGILSGTARPYVGARINLCAFYLVGLPVALLASFVYHFEFVGLWYGMLAAQMSCFCMMVFALCRTDWKHQSCRAEEELAQVVAAGEDEDEESGLLNSDL